MSNKMKMAAGTILFAAGVTTAAVADEMLYDVPAVAPQTGQQDPSVMNHAASGGMNHNGHHMGMKDGRDGMTGSHAMAEMKQKKGRKMGGC